MKMDGSAVEGKSFFKMLGFFVFSKLDWGSYNASIDVTAFKEILALILPLKFLSSDVVLFLHKSTI